MNNIRFHHDFPQAPMAITRRAGTLCAVWHVIKARRGKVCGLMKQVVQS